MNKEKEQYPWYLIELCGKYVAHITKIERCTDTSRLEILEEQRVQLHYQVIDAFNRIEIIYRDRWEVTELAYRIARDRQKL